MEDKTEDDTADSIDILVQNIKANDDGKGMNFAHSVRQETTSQKLRFDIIICRDIAQFIGHLR